MLCFVFLLCLSLSQACSNDNLVANERNVLAYLPDISCGVTAVCSVVDGQCHVIEIGGLGFFVSINYDLPNNVVFQYVTLVSGDIRVFDSSMDTLDFPSLTTVTGEVTLSSLTRFSADNLVSVGNGMTIFRTSLTELKFPSLHHVKQRSILVLENNGLTNVEFPELETAVNIYIQSNENLTSSVKFPQLTYCGIFSINVCPVTSLSFPKLGSLQLIEVNYLDNLITLDFPMLTHVNEYFHIWHASSVQAIEVPQLSYVGGNFWLQGSAMTNISCPVLSSIGGLLYIKNNQILQNVSFPMLKSIELTVTLMQPLADYFVDFSRLRSVCSSFAQNNSNVLDGGTTFILCPNLLNAGNCKNFPAEKVVPPQGGCSQ